MFDLKHLVLVSWQGFYSPINPQINPRMCLDMTYPPAKLGVDWSKETQVLSLKKLMFDDRPPARRHPQSNNQVSPHENLVNNKSVITSNGHINIIFTAEWITTCYLFQIFIQYPFFQHQPHQHNESRCKKSWRP